MDDKMLTADEAWGVLQLVKTYLMLLGADLPRRETRSIGRLLSEVQYTLEGPEVPAGPPGEGGLRRVK